MFCDAPCCFEPDGRGGRVLLIPALSVRLEVKWLRFLTCESERHGPTVRQTLLFPMPVLARPLQNTPISTETTAAIQVYGGLKLGVHNRFFRYPGWRIPSLMIPFSFTGNPPTGTSEKPKNFGNGSGICNPIWDR